MDQVVDWIVIGAGLLLLVVSVLALALNLVADVLKVLRQSTGLLFEVEGFKDWIEKLPERYFVPTVLLLLGILLADPTRFAEIMKAIFPA